MGHSTRGPTTSPWKTRCASELDEDSHGGSARVVLLLPMRSNPPACLVLLLNLIPTAVAQGNQELGRMWTFEDPPLAHLEEAYGFRPDQEWLDALRLGSLGLGALSLDGEDPLSVNGSASFVSSRGLILTNTRSIRDAVTATRPRDLDILNSGFVATSQAQEFRLRARHDAWLTAAQLVRIVDVTDDVEEGVTAADDATRMQEKRAANRKAILDAARDSAPELEPQIVRLDQGAAVHLYQYRVYDDVRLVFTPHMQVAHFGGDLDNFTYPRTSLDFAFLRAYEDGEPADTAQHHFEWGLGGVQDGELVFVSGHPGPTMRLRTSEQLGLERDLRIPMRIEQLTHRLRIWSEPGSGTYTGEFDPENPSRYWSWVRTSLLGLENELKAARGALRGLEDASWMARRAEMEDAFQARVRSDEPFARTRGDLWERIADVVRDRRTHEARARFHTPSHPVLEVAVAIVRLCDPAATEEQRLRAESAMAVWAGAEINVNYFGTAFSRDHFVRARGWLPEEDPLFTRVMAGRSAREFIDELERRAPGWLGDPAERAALLEAGWEAIRESDDPTVVAARELARLMSEHESFGAELDAREEALGLELGRAWRESYGGRMSPDGTRTLRFSDGVVRGLPTASPVAPYRTTFDDLYTRNTARRNEYPYNLPEAWLDLEDEIDGTTPVNFASTNDMAGSGSGSVVVNQALEVVGVVVDGDAPSLYSAFAVGDDRPRVVSTHVDGILEALVTVYAADHIATELTAN